MADLKKTNGFMELANKRKNDQNEIEKTIVAPEEKKETKEKAPSKAVRETDAKKTIKSNEQEASAVHSVGKVGRPKGKSCTRTTINIPDDIMDFVNVASGITFKGNMNRYVVSLIEKDIEENRSMYEKILKIKG